MRSSDWSSDVCSSDLLFRIDYRDRVAPPFGSPLGILTNPLFTSLVTFNPSAAQLDAAIVGASDPLGNATGGPYNPANVIALIDGRDRNIARSEEHTSELQSLMRISYAVFCLKKKKKR